jgi:hypothetical protein
VALIAIEVGTWCSVVDSIPSLRDTPSVLVYSLEHLALLGLRALYGVIGDPSPFPAAHFGRRCSAFRWLKRCPDVVHIPSSLACIISIRGRRARLLAVPHRSRGADPAKRLLALDQIQVVETGPPAWNALRRDT